MGQAQAKRGRVLIIGGSMAGLFAALLLRRAGWQVEVFERIGAELSARGTGIVTHGELLDLMQACGVDADAARVGVPVFGRRVFDRDGRLTHELPLEQIVTSWGHLYALLMAALPAAHYHHGRDLLRVEETADAVRAHFADGSVEEGDLLIGADGIYSTVRAQLAPEAQPVYAGYVAWRGMVDEADLSAATRADLCDHLAFTLPPGEQMLGYPVAGPNEALARGRRRFNFVWYRPASAELLRDLLTDREGVTHPVSIPPNRIRPEVVEEARRGARALLSPQFVEVVERAPQPFIQVIRDLETPRLDLGRRTVILGDAAFVARPHVGMGVTKAAVDAAVLVEALSRHGDDLAGALADFSARRVAFGRAVVARARQLGSGMRPEPLTDAERALAEYHRRPEAVMAETAVATGIAA